MPSPPRRRTILDRLRDLLNHEPRRGVGFLLAPACGGIYTVLPGGARQRKSAAAALRRVIRGRGGSSMARRHRESGDRQGRSARGSVGRGGGACGAGRPGGRQSDPRGVEKRRAGFRERAAENGVRGPGCARHSATCRRGHAQRGADRLVAGALYENAPAANAAGPRLAAGITSGGLRRLAANPTCA